jgi:hypothetical protein
MLNASEAKKKLNGKEFHWYFGYNRERWNLIVLKRKIKWLRELWEVSLWDRLCGRDIPRCDRCKVILLDFPRYISAFPLCECCYDDFICEALNDRDD